MTLRLTKYTVLLFVFFQCAVMAQYYSFGRNKVQYSKFDWKVLKTEHFDIYYYDQFEDMAKIGAAYAEDAFVDLKMKFNHLVLRRIPLIFYNTHLHFQQTNTTGGFIPEGVGGFFEFVKGRVVIPFDGSVANFRHVIKHELVHVFTMSKLYNSLADHRIPTDIEPPLWYVEGLAEFFSTSWDSQAEMVMRDAVLYNYFTGINSFNQVYGTFLMYKAGQNFLGFITEKYGEEKVNRLLENVWIYDSFDRVMEFTIGKPIHEINLEYENYLRKNYFPLYKDEYPLDGFAKKITNFGYNFTPVYYKKNNEEYVVFSANRNGYSSLYKQKLSDTTLNESPKLILQGEKSDEFETFHLFQSAIDVSKEGEVAFVTKSGENDVIHFYSLEEDKIVRSFYNKALISISSPKFSEDGKNVVFQAVDNKGFSDLYIFNISENEVKRITNDYYDDKSPVWLDNQTIIFTSDRTSGCCEKKYNLFSLHLTDFRLYQITNVNANIYDPVISKNKNEILFSSDLDGIRNIYKIKYDSVSSADSIIKITDFMTTVFNPSLISDTEILVSGYEKGGLDIYKIDLEKLPQQNKKVEMIPINPLQKQWVAKSLELEPDKEPYQNDNEYTLDYAQSQITTDPVYGTRGGAVLSLSDLFGNDNYYFLLYNTAEVQDELLNSFNVEMARVNLGSRANYSYGIFHFRGRRYDLQDVDEYYFERSYGGFFEIHFPLSKFTRIETSTSISNSDKQVIEGVLERKALLWSNSISYVTDNSLWGPTGPLDGQRFRFTLAFTGDVKYNNVNYYSIIADYRRYLRLGFMSALAMRTALFYNEGKEARRYFMGGSWDLRGWPRWSIRGEKMWISSLELRFPLVDQFRIKFPFGDIGLPGFRGGLFFDSGGAWDDTYNETLGSIGGGFRFSFFGAIVFRYDIGKTIQNDFTKLQKGWFYQFFFGWDF